MRTRLLRPGFFENEELAALPPHARLLFAGLWLMADRAGRLKDRPAVIRATLFPFEPDVEVEAHLNALAESGFIHRYSTTSGGKAVEIVSFAVHQNPHHREPDTKLPGPHEILSKSAKPRKSRGAAPPDPDPDPYTNTDPDTVFGRYVVLAAEALRQTLLDHHTDNVGLVTERFKELCIEQEHVCDPELAAQAVEAALEARARKASQLLELMRRPARRA